MNEKQLEQTHVDETIELIQIEQNMLDTKQQELTQEMNHSTKDTANHKIRAGSNEAFMNLLLNIANMSRNCF